ncbi:MAG: 50S ribosomal protein L6 [Chloroflexi bacterium]|nr:50S ribosomal protein L6 [Chloroflexota bacterium]
MSRVGRKPIPIPAGVKVQIDGSEVQVQGPKGQLRATFHPDMRVVQEDGSLRVERPDDAREHRALHGLTRSLLANMVTGVTSGFRKDMEMVGVGYRAQKQGDKLVLSLGYSHPVEVAPPPGISFEVETPTRMAVVGIDKQLVGQVAAEVRAWRPPEPYKGKGIKYVGEVIQRKAGKSGKVGGKKR